MALRSSLRGRFAIVLAALFLVTAALALGLVGLQVRGTTADPLVDAENTIIVRSGTGSSGFRIVLEPIEGEPAGFDPTLLLAAAWLVLVPLCAVAAWRVAGSLTAQVNTLTEAARMAGPANLGRRVPVEGAHDLGRLGEAMNGLLDRFERHEADRRQLVDNAVHEVRNPLAVLQTSLEVALADTAEADALRDAAEVSQRAGERIARTIDGLQATLRDRAPESARATVDLSALAREAGRDYEALAVSRGVSLEVAAAPDVLVIADRESLRRAIANLLANAIRHAPAGSPVVIGAGAVPGWRWLGVRDFGPGIRSEEQPLVFGRGWRGIPEVATGSGSGIGLALVRQIAEAHGGTVRLSSMPRAGCSFVVWLPAVDDAAGGAIDGQPDPLWWPRNALPA